MLSQTSHSSDKVWFEDKMFLFFFFLSFPSFIICFCFSFFCFFFKFCNSQNQSERHATKHRWNKRSKVLLFPSLLSLSHPFLLPLTTRCTDWGLPCSPLLFFSLALGKPANAPQRGQNFPFIQLIFTRNPINNTCYFNKTLSEWFDAKQIHYVRSQ